MGQAGVFLLQLVPLACTQIQAGQLVDLPFQTFLLALALLRTLAGLFDGFAGLAQLLPGLGYLARQGQMTALAIE